MMTGLLFYNLLLNLLMLNDHISLEMIRNPFDRVASKQNDCFSDFPFPDHVPDYPSHTHMAEYIKSYTKRFGLEKHICFNTKVVKIEKVAEGWKMITVEVDNKGKHKSEYKETFVKFVAIASGHHAKPSMPQFEGQETFDGRIFHSTDL